MRRAPALFLSILACILVLVLQVTVAPPERSKAVTTFSQGPLGVSLFAQYLRIKNPDSVSTLRQAFLEDEHVDSSSDAALFILAPTRPFSAREANIVAQHVRNGGTLIASFHDNKTYEALSALIITLGNVPRIKESEKYRASFGTRVRPRATSSLVPEQVDLQFYALNVFDSTECRMGLLSCYVHEQTIGNGKLILIAGVPPIANSLLLKNENYQIAAHLANSYSRFIFDEYHHFYSEKDWTDLLKTPWISLPLFSMIVGAFLFFWLGQPELEPLPEYKNKKPSAIDLGEAVVRTIMTKDTNASNHALAIQQMQSLQVLFPKDSEEIRKLTESYTGIMLSEKLWILHRELLSRRGIHFNEKDA
jgi:hypothetical protein